MFIKLFIFIVQPDFNRLTSTMQVLVIDSFFYKWGWDIYLQYILYYYINLKFDIFTFLFQTEMTTAERELDQNTNFDWNRIQESGQDVEPICGPGYTGLVNLGNR